MLGCSAPAVKGITVYITDFKRSLADKLAKDFFSEPSQAGQCASRSACLAMLTLLGTELKFENHVQLCQILGTLLGHHAVLPSCNAGSLAVSRLVEIIKMRKQLGPVTFTCA